MKNRLFQIVMTVALLASIAGCQREEIIPDIPGETNSEVGVFGDFIKMKLNVVAPDPIKVGTKAVDPDGKGVQTMTLFCFDQHGLFISTATASIEQELDQVFQLTDPNKEVYRCKYCEEKYINPIKRK